MRLARAPAICFTSISPFEWRITTEWRSFSVEDFGPGIEKQYVGRLFEKFFQVPGTVSGTGLGLAISKEFIEAQGGTIRVESQVGKGSIFSVELKKA